MKHVKLFEQFIVESRVNEARGLGLLRLLNNSISGDIEFQTIADMEKDGDTISRQLRTAAKKVSGGDGQKALVIYAPFYSDWNYYLTVAKEWGGKFIEIKDEYGSAIVFAL
jgi:hypothetical protein